MFGITIPAQSSKLAYRIFLLFVLSALVPIGVLGMFSLQELTSQKEASLEKGLRQKAKSYGLLLNNRLLLLDEKLVMEIEKAEKIKKIGLHKASLKGFLSLFYFTLSDPARQGLQLANSLSSSDRKSLKENNPVLLFRQEATGYSSAYLLRSIRNTTIVVAAKITNTYLWGEAEAFDLSKQICVYGNNNQVVFCTSNERRHQLESIKLVWASVSTGVVNNEDAGLYLAYWRLFTQANFNYPSLMVSVSVNYLDEIKQVAQLRDVFIIVSILVLVIITLLTTIQIRRYFYPLDELMKGIERITNNDFKTPVLVETQDEFNQLANSFNFMSSKVSNQIDFLSAISAMDQHILASMPIKNLLFNIISKLNNNINFENVSLIVMDEHNKSKGTIYCNDAHEMPVDMLIEEGSQLKITRVTCINNDEHLPSYLSSIKSDLVSTYAVIPVLVADKLEAILVFGFTRKETIDIVEDRLKELANRLAIAFEKLAWDKKLYQQAHHDPLTELPNRQLLNDRLAQAVIQAARNGFCFSVMFLDLDRFKVVNDTLGHSSGDELLIQLSKRLEDNLRDGDTVARQGGDEFIILLSDSSPREKVVQRASHLAKKLLSEIAKPYQIKNKTVHVSASIGVAFYPLDGNSGDILLKHADAAMYHAKSSGKNNFQLYSKKLNTQSIERLELESEMYQAISSNEFELYYQPKVNAMTGKILGAEALIRWNHKVHGLVSPFKFIPLAEETGFINQIGEWTIQEACRQTKRWQKEGLDEIVVSVNLSAKQFRQQDLVNVVSKALAKEQLSPHFIDLEIVEGTAMDDMQKTVEILNSLKALGVTISIDDYGTGFSTLSYIKQFPIDNLKIDICFIRNITKDKGDQAIVASTILLAEKLGINVVAEGVEDREQLAILQDMTCHEVQGYYFSPPVPAENFAVLLKNGFGQKL